jgi:predicted glutamine amidotransferase
MCRMIGITNFSYNKHKVILEDFIRLAERGKIPPNNPPGHLDGWGIAYYKKGKAVVFKSGGSILKEKYVFFNKLKELGKTGILIAHLRKSSWNYTSSKANSHPFKLGNYILGHNGTILDFKKLGKSLPKKYRPSSKALDSEMYLRHLAASIGPSTSGLEAAIDHLKKRYKHTSLSCLFSDGLKLYVYREFTRLPRYYTLYHTKKKGSDLICSEPVNKKLSWKLLPNNKLFAF